MKTKIITLLSIIVLASSLLNAQTSYNKLLDYSRTEWYIFNVYIPVKPGNNQNQSNSFTTLDYGRYSAQNDTLIDTKIYKKLYHDYFYPGSDINDLVGFMREDTVTQQVFGLGMFSANEYKMYDFSLQLNDTINLTFPNSNWHFPDGTYTVTTVDMASTEVGLRKQLTLKGSGTDSLIWIESIGSIIHPIYLYGSDYGYGQFAWGPPGGCIYPYALGLACKTSNSVKYYQSCTYTEALNNPCIYKYDSCNYFNNCSNVQEITAGFKCRVQPNPTEDGTNLEVEIEQDDNVLIELYDVFGKKVKTIAEYKLQTGKNSIAINVSDLQSGYYLVKANGERFTLKATLVISK